MSAPSWKYAPVPGQSSPRAFSGKPGVAGQTHHSYEKFARQAAPVSAWRSLLGMRTCTAGRLRCGGCKLRGSHSRCCLHVTRSLAVRSLDTYSYEWVDAQWLLGFPRLNLSL